MTMDPVGIVSGLGMLGIFLLVFVFGVLGTIFWIWMLIDCAMKESNQGNDKIIWVAIILVTHFLGALIYFIFRRPQRKMELGQ